MFDPRIYDGGTLAYSPGRTALAPFSHSYDGGALTYSPAKRLWHPSPTHIWWRRPHLLARGYTALTPFSHSNTMAAPSLTHPVVYSSDTLLPLIYDGGALVTRLVYSSDSLTWHPHPPSQDWWLHPCLLARYSPGRQLLHAPTQDWWPVEL